MTSSVSTRMSLMQWSEEKTDGHASSGSFWQTAITLSPHTIRLDERYPKKPKKQTRQKIRDSPLPEFPSSWALQRGFSSPHVRRLRRLHELPITKAPGEQHGPVSVVEDSVAVKLSGRPTSGVERRAFR